MKKDQQTSVQEIRQLFISYLRQHKPSEVFIGGEIKLQFDTGFLYAFMQTNQLALDSFAKIVKDIKPFEMFPSVPNFVDWPLLSEETLKILDLVTNLKQNVDEQKPVIEIMEALKQEFPQYHAYLSPELQEDLERTYRASQPLKGSPNMTVVPLSAKSTSQSSSAKSG